MSIDYHGVRLEQSGAATIGGGAPGWEAAEIEASQIAFSTGMRVLCVGFGLGLVAAYVADMLGGASQVVGYEADGNLAVLSRAVRVNSEPMLVRWRAVGERNGALQLPRRTLSERTAFCAPPGEVDMVPLWTALREEGCNAAVLDIEGRELEALSTLGTGDLQALVVELHDAARTVDLEERLKRLGLETVYYRAVGRNQRVVGARYRQYGGAL